MFKIENHTRLKEGDPRRERLVAQAQTLAERFAASNPYWGKSTFITLAWRGNEYVARVKYRSTQGTSHVTTVFENSLD